jgi:hydroxymethylpyrimidine pyrophosphatase-like HAD family hydrolase
MKYKALILDLDGTTVQNIVETLPSPGVSRAIKLAKDKILVCVATGRPLYKALNIINHLKLSGPCVTGGGTQIYDPVQRKILREYTLNPGIIPQVDAISVRYNLQVGIFNGEIDLPLDKVNQETKILGMYLPVISPDIIDEVQSELLLIPGVAVHKMTSWEKGYLCLDVTSAKATKLHGIKILMSLLNVTKDEIIGVGDSYNDFPLLMASGLKIAMGNAVPELKAVADFIAPSIEEDGVATIINKFILNT